VVTVCSSQAVPIATTIRDFKLSEFQRKRRRALSGRFNNASASFVVSTTFAGIHFVLLEVTLNRRVIARGSLLNVAVGGHEAEHAGVAAGYSAGRL
jgi:hypothetical protein